MKLRGLILLLGLALATTACGSFQVEAGFKRPAELTATVVAQSARPTAAPRPQLGKLAFVRGGDIWAKALPDGEARRLTWDGRNSEPRWSPSGDWLAFWKDDRVWVSRQDGSDAHQIMGSRAIEGFAWSPVEDLIAYTNGSRLLAVSADGSDRRELVSEGSGGSLEASLGAIAWSPDGQWLAYTRSEATQEASGAPTPIYQGLAVVRSDGSGAPRDLYGDAASLGSWSYVAGWSGDGQSLLFWHGALSTTSSLADGLPLLRLPVAGQAPVEVVPRMLVHRELLDWSADGRLALVEGGRKETWDGKWITLVSGSTVAPLSDRGRSDLHPAWSPDARWIAFSGGPAAPAGGATEEAKRAVAERRIWLMQPDGSAKRQLTGDPAYRDERPRWSADGSSLLFGRIAGGQQMQLWMMQPDGSDPRQVVDELTAAPGPASQWLGPNGYANWDSMYDWWTGRLPARKPIPPVRLPQRR